MLRVAFYLVLAVSLEWYAIHALIDGHTMFRSARYDFREAVSPHVHPFAFWINVLGAAVFGGLCALAVWLELKKWRESRKSDDRE